MTDSVSHFATLPPFHHKKSKSLPLSLLLAPRARDLLLLASLSRLSVSPLCLASLSRLSLSRLSLSLPPHAEAMYQIAARNRSGEMVQSPGGYGEPACPSLTLCPLPVMEQYRIAEEGVYSSCGEREEELPSD